MHTRQFCCSTERKFFINARYQGLQQLSRFLFVSRNIKTHFTFQMAPILLLAMAVEQFTAFQPSQRSHQQPQTCWNFFQTGFTGLTGFILLAALRMRAPKPQSPPARVNTLIGFQVINGTTKIYNFTRYLLEILIFRRRRIEFSHFHLGSEKE